VKKLLSLSLERSKFLARQQLDSRLEIRCSINWINLSTYSPVHLTGNYIPDDDMDQDPYDSDLMMGSSDEEDELEGVSDEDDEEEEEEDEDM
jgi:hypothetical protein